MRINIKTASKNAEVSVLLAVKTEHDQIVFLIYTYGQYILLENIGANILSPLFTITEAIELEKIFKLKVFEKSIIREIEITRMSEEDLIKITELYSEFNIFYQKNNEYFNLVKFNKTDAEDDEEFILNFSPNMLIMQPVEISEYFSLDLILEKISKVGVANITKYENDFLKNVSNQIKLKI